MTVEEDIEIAEALMLGTTVEDCLAVPYAVLATHTWGRVDGVERCRHCSAHVVQFGPERGYARVYVGGSSDALGPVRDCDTNALVDEAKKAVAEEMESGQ
jgi:hypothetical protein